MEKEELKQLLDGLRQAIRDGIDTTAIISSGINDEWGAVLEEKKRLLMSNQELKDELYNLEANCASLSLKLHDAGEAFDSIASLLGGLDQLEDDAAAIGISSS